MVQRIGGARRKTRYTLQKEPNKRGKFSLTSYFQSFKPGEKVLLKPEPAIQKGMPYRRFIARLGVIKSKQGRCYIVKINDFGKEKTLIVHPVHLKRYSTPGEAVQTK